MKIQTVVGFLVLIAPWKMSLSNDPIGKAEHSRITNMIEIIEGWKKKNSNTKLPWITLSYAQSLDGKIALCRDSSSSSSNLPISGNESLYLTHALRSIHDGILVGGKTLLIDNPRLSNRLWGSHQPRPIILDPHLKYIRELGNARKLKGGIVCCSEEAILEKHHDDDDDDDNDLMYLRCHLDENGQMDLNEVFRRLKTQYHIQSIMVEGGAYVISSLASQTLVDCLCITIAPKLIGQQYGLASIASIAKNDWVDLADANPSSSVWFTLGNDCMFLAAWPKGN